MVSGSVAIGAVEQSGEEPPQGQSTAGEVPLCFLPHPYPLYRCFFLFFFCCFCCFYYPLNPLHPLHPCHFFFFFFFCLFYYPLSPLHPCHFFFFCIRVICVICGRLWKETECFV